MTKTKGIPIPALGRPPSSSWWVDSQCRTREEFDRRQAEEQPRMSGVPQKAAYAGPGPETHHWQANRRQSLFHGGDV